MKSPPNLFIDLEKVAFLHPSAIVGRTVRLRKPERVHIGAGSIIDDFTYVSCALKVGRYTHIGANGVVIGGDARVTIGDFVNIAPGCRLIAASNDFACDGLVGPTIPPEYAGASITSEIHIADHVLLGTNVVILPGVSLPEGVAIGACSLVHAKMSLAPWTLYAGVPAKPLRSRTGEAMRAAAERLKKERSDEWT
ncbi:MAG TPA: hypothetical protein PKC67_07860 [Kiritimatiellia bacterium]|nr:hypothetical protein [Kiritimatiellia bacterium]HMP34253.1 hypothetical protein [Kiritimatiellia bacterium]